MKQRLIVLFMGLFMFGFVNKANASSFTINVSEDGYYSKSFGWYNNIKLDATTSKLYGNSEILLNFNIADSIPSLIKALANNETLKSIKLRIFQYNYWNTPDLKAFYLTEGSIFTEPPQYDITNPIGQLITNSSNNGKWVDIDINPAQFDTDNIYSIVLTNLFYPDIEHNSSYIKFYSKDCDNGKYTPYLSIETSTPTPEPSSMILGVIGLASTIGLRKRKKTI